MTAPSAQEEELVHVRELLEAGHVRAKLIEAALDGLGQHRHPDGARAVLIRAEDVEPRAVQWLWAGRIPRGKLTILDGDPDVGKSTITLDIAARVSTGTMMPDGADGTLGGVVLLSAEDDAADTIIPRLIAASADLTRIRLLDGILLENGETRPAAIPLDLEAVEEAIVASAAVLVIVDPLMAFLAGETNSHRDQDVRRALAPLAKLAEHTGVAVVVVRHLNKSGGGQALYRGGGSIGIIGAARSGLLAARDPEDETRRVLAITKANLAERAPSLTYRLVAADQTVAVEWLGTSAHSAQTLLFQDDGEEQTAVRTAMDFLQDELRWIAMPPKELFEKAKKAGISERTVRRAKDRIGVVTRKSGMRDGWVWELPKVATDSEDVQSPGLATFAEDGQTGEPKSSIESPKVANPPEDGQAIGTDAGGHLRDCDEPAPLGPSWMDSL